jgi:hypothetical protein
MSIVEERTIRTLGESGIIDAGQGLTLTAMNPFPFILSVESSCPNDSEFMPRWPIVAEWDASAVRRSRLSTGALG